MRMTTLLAAAAASSLVVSPALANPATPLSLSNASSVKASTPAKKSNKLAGAAIGGLIGAGILAIVIVGAVNNDDDDPSDSN